MNPRPFRRHRTFWARVPRLGGNAVQRSLETHQAETADAICDFLGWCTRNEHEWLLNAMAEGRVSVRAAWSAHRAGTLAAFIKGEQLARVDCELEPHIARWQQELSRQGHANPATRRRYETQVRTLVKKGFRRSQMTRATVRDWLATLKVAAPNRYRAAMSSFCSFLVVEEILETNPVMAVPMSRESEPRTRHLSQDEAVRYLETLPAGEHRAFQAFLLATAADVETARAVRFRDTDREAKTVFLAGEKTPWRKRTVTVYWRWEPLWTQYVEPFLRQRRGLPDANVFTLSYDALRSQHAAAGIDDYTMKDHRHTWAVQALRDGLSIQVVAHQLGHRDAVMTLRVYSKYVPVAADFSRRPDTITPTQGVANR